MTLLCMARYKLARLEFVASRALFTRGRVSNTKPARCRLYLTDPSRISHQLLGYSDRSSDGSILEKTSRNSSRQTDATVGRGEWRDIALMHCVTASEEHRIRHSRAIEMGSFRLAILSRVDI